MKKAIFGQWHTPAASALRSVLVMLVLMLSMQTARAAYVFKGYGSWSGMWDNKSNTRQPEQQNGVYLISCPEELAYVAWAINSENNTERNNYLHAQYLLTADLDMGAHFWNSTNRDYPFTGTIDGGGHTISNLYCFEATFDSGSEQGEDDFGGCLFAKTSNATFKNLTMRKCYGESARFASILVGEATSAITFENVHLIECGLSTHGYANAGGFVAYDKSCSNLKFTNCSSHLININDCGAYTGGFVGYEQNINAVMQFENCIAHIEDAKFLGGNYNGRGGFVGSMVNDGTLMKMNHCAVYSGDAKRTGYSEAAIVGQSYWAAYTMADIYVVSSMGAMSADDLWLYAMGNNQRSEFYLPASLSRPATSTAKTKEAFATACRLNEGGMHVAVRQYDGKYYPIPVAEGNGELTEFFLYSSSSDSLTLQSVVTEGLGETTCVADNGRTYGYMAMGLPSTYTVTKAAAKWIMDDETKTIADKTRLAPLTFGGKATASGMIDFNLARIPVLAWRTCTYANTRQQATLQWTVANQVTRPWSAKGARFIIYRNGERADSVSFDESMFYEWTDKTPVTGSLNTYTITMKCDAVCFTEDDTPAPLTTTLDCSGLAAIHTSKSGTVGNIQIQVSVPNSVAFDGCKVGLVKHVLTADADLALQQDTVVPMAWQTFRYAPDAADSVLTLTFKDEAAVNPCTRWVYEAVCYDFLPASEAYGRHLWGNAVDVLPVSDLAITDFTASKGESTSKINLSWTVSKSTGTGNILYVLSRKMYERGQAAEATDTLGWKQIYTTASSAGTGIYADEALPGYVYKYQLKAYPSCDDTYATNIYTHATTIGYAASRGTIMGAITYEGNTAVQGVDVRLVAEEGSFGQKGGSYAMYFDGADAALPLAAGVGQQFWADDWTLSFLYLPVLQQQALPLVAQPGRWALYVSGSQLMFDSLATTTAFSLPDPYAYNHLMLRHSKAAKTISIGYAQGNMQNDSVAHWVKTFSDDVLAAQLPAGTQLAQATDQLLFGLGFKGYIDEVRLWETALTDQQVSETYNRFLSGNEQGLAAYYTFDSGVEEYAFDTSHPGGRWNNHHTTVPSPGYPQVSADCLPDETVLCYRGVTDANGEYQISGIPFVGEGSNYQVVPVYGTHEFSPASTRRYVSQQSLAHSDVNFTDKSSFKVPVQAYYVYGNMPAEGLYVYVDGVMQHDDDNKNIQTDRNGHATVSVPIGRHRVSLGAPNHTMANHGYACSVAAVSDDGNCRVTPLSDDRGYVDYQYDLTASTLFYDSTFVRVVGRVAGGKDEAQKPVGFSQGHANLGAYNITLEPSVNGLVNESERYPDITIAPDTAVAIDSKTVYHKANVTVETDSRTGEYIAMLPPVRWTVKSVVSKTGAISDIDLERTSNFIAPDLLQTKADTLWHDNSDSLHNALADSTYDTFEYCVRKDYILYNTPQLTITNLLPATSEADSLMLGMAWLPVQYVDADETVVNDTIAMWRPDAPHDGTAAAYTLGCPVFKTSETYRMRLRLVETYVNHDTQQSTEVPVRGAKVNITNKCASTVARQLATGDYEIVDTLNTTTTQTAAGTADYEFTAGFPNFSGDHLLPLEVSYVVNGTTYSAPVVNAYVIGAVASTEGNNYLAGIKGPNDIITVLCDPPGSGSSAYIDEGTTITSKHANGGAVVVTTNDTKEASVGMRVTQMTITGPTGQVTLDSKHEQISTATIKIVDTKTTNWQTETTCVFNKKVQTGTNAKHVGAMGDVYIGHSTNIIYARSRNLYFRDAASTAGAGIVLTSQNGRRFSLDNYSGIAQKNEIESDIVASQFEIVNTIIPDLVKQRNALVPESHYVDDLSEEPKAAVDRYTYYVKKSSRDKEYWVPGKDNDYVVTKPSELTKNCVQDSVNLYNQWIKGWQDAIRATEEQKVKTFKSREQQQEKIGTSSVTYGYLENQTFDGGGATVSRSLKLSDVSMFSMNYALTTTFESTVKVESEESEGQVKQIKTQNGGGVSGNYTHNSTFSENQSVTVGYTLVDADNGDHFSVDVYLPSASDTEFAPAPFMFCTQAGQSRSPWEKPQTSIYYVDPQTKSHYALDGGTENTAAPSVTCAEHTLTQLASGSTATLKLTLANTSTCTTGFKLIPFQLFLENNPDGLIVEVDGQPLYNMPITYLGPGQSVERTVTIRQARADVLDYEKLVFVLRHSEISARDSVTLHFQPAAPAISIKNNGSSVISAETSNKQVLFTLNDYDTCYDRFAGIRLRYRPQGVADWVTQSVLINDSSLYAGKYGVMPDVAWRKLSLAPDTLSFDMTALPDGTYEVCAQTFSIVGVDELTKESNVCTLKKDTKAPVNLGTPMPAAGVYSAGDEISITFNEPVDMNSLNAENFYVTAALNDAEVKHQSGLHFDGTTPAKTSSRINILGKKRGVGLWYKPVTGKRSCLLSQRMTSINGEQVPFKVWYNADATLSVEANGQTFTSTRKANAADGTAEQDWMYLILLNDAQQRTIALYNMFGTSNTDQSTFIDENLADTWAIADEDANMPLWVGGSAAGDECHADMEGLVIYDDEATFETIYGGKDSKHAANVRGLEAYWPMDECYGYTAYDRVRQRNLTVSGNDNWYNPTDNYALRLNGTSQYMKICTDHDAVGKNDDYVVELLFRTAQKKPGRHMTLFSNGWGGEGTTEEPANVADRMSLALNADGALELNAAGKTYTMGTAYDDNSWHHLALNVHRDAYATVSVDTVDISNTCLIAGNALGAFSNSFMTLGARRYRVADRDTFDVDDFFEGDIDEVRIWDANKTAISVNRNVSSHLTGNEPGLAAYYPFEHTTIVANQNKTQPYLGDCVADSTRRDAMPTVYGYDAAATDERLAAAVTTAQGARLKSADFMSRIDVSWEADLVKKNKIVFSFPDNVSDARLHHTTVNFSVRNVKDEAGNFMAQPVDWNFYTDLRDLYIMLPTSDITQQLGTSQTVTASIVNMSANAVSWKLSGLPAWLEVSEDEGTLPAQSTALVTLTTKAATSIGRYSCTLKVASDNGVPDAADITLKVIGDKPDWSVTDNGSDEWMALLGRLKMGNTWCNDADNLVAAFDADGVCHGLASPTYSKEMDTYFVHMDIQGGMPKADNRLYFYVWDSQTGLTYSRVSVEDAAVAKTYALPFVDKQILGSFVQPTTITAENQVNQTIMLKKGWNWVSHWIQPASDNINEVFALDKGVVTAIKRRTNNGTDLTLRPEESYHLYAEQDGDLLIDGAIIDPDTVEVTFKNAAVNKSGVAWAWLGYPHSTSMTLQEAFADFKPVVGDIIKSQTAYAMYNGYAWVGRLTYLAPGTGYLYGYHGTASCKWHFPASKVQQPDNMTAARVAAMPSRQRFSSNPYAYSGNMTVLGDLRVDGLTGAGWQVAAFVDGICRGWAPADSAGRLYLTLAGDSQGRVTYRACDARTGNVVAVDLEHAYADNAMLGSWAAPAALSAATASHYALDVDPWAYEDYTYVTATVQTAAGEAYPNDYELAAYCGTECRGVAAGKAGQKCAIAIYGAAGETYTFRLWDKTTATELLLDGTKAYDANTPVQNITLRVSTTGIEGIESDDDHRWYDTKGYRYGRKPNQPGVYIKDNQAVTLRK